MIKSDANLLGYSLFSSHHLPDWREMEYVPERVPKGLHYTFLVSGNSGEDVSLAYVLPLLKERNPRRVIWVYTSRKGAPLFENNPAVDRVEVIPVERWAGMLWDEALSEMEEWIAHHRPRLGWVCNISGDPFFALISRLIGKGRAFGLIMDERGRPVVIGNRWMQFTMEVFYPELCDGLLNEYNIFNKRQLLALSLGEAWKSRDVLPFYVHQAWDRPISEWMSGGYILVSPHAPLSTREWNCSKWKDLLERIWDEYHIKLVVLTKEGCEEFDSLGESEGIEVVYVSNLDEIVYLMARAKMMLSVHNELIHLASAVGLPTLVVCGPRNEGPEFGGLHLSLRKEVPCAPCNLSSCSRMYCMDSLTVEDVFSIFKYHWRAMTNGAFDLAEAKRYSSGLKDVAVEVSDSRLPDFVYSYVPVSGDCTAEVIHRISRLAYAWAWNRSNSYLLGEEIDIGFDECVDWAISKDVVWEEFEGAIKSQIRMLKEWEQKLSLLVMRLRELFPPFPKSLFKRAPMDPENLWNSLENFDQTLPFLLRKLHCDRPDPEAPFTQRIRDWIEIKRDLLRFIREYREFLEKFLFSKGPKPQK